MEKSNKVLVIRGGTLPHVATDMIVFQRLDRKDLFVLRSAEWENAIRKDAAEKSLPEPEFVYGIPDVATFCKRNGIHLFTPRNVCIVCGHEWQLGDYHLVETPDYGLVLTFSSAPYVEGTPGMLTI